MTVRSSNSYNKADIEYNYKYINEQIALACQKAGRSRDEITFLSAVKTVPADIINYAISLGLDHIGENKVQELLEKYDEYDLKNASLQFIGHLQTNKVRQIVGKVDMIQSVDSVKLAQEISKRSEALGICTDVLVEVNTGREESKSGVMVEEAYELIDRIREFNGIKVKGLMTIPPICEPNEKNLKYFSMIYNLFIDIRSKKVDNVDMSILSMGMSDDYADAIAEGATMVRIGSALFGKRIYN
ncbi:MAG: YggS family pyridoxal phosphate-dependent enzyme [Clostridia bacterium]|nr:YggS family pyridoxal phosphate-dependent enzyme [Clostridia bacterium]